jgi:phenylalanine-4-hydroxylase
MFAQKEFADFSQEIGLASLGCSELELKRLASIYWFTIEFGVCLDDKGQKKAYGAGLMSSFTELEHCVSDVPQFKPFDPYEIA